MNAELVQQYPFIDKSTTGTYSYYKVPKLMFTYGQTIGIRADETMFYSVLLDRVDLSLENGKVDSEGRIYIYFSRDKAAECMGWSKRKTIEVFKRLKEHGLLYEEDELDQNGKMVGRKLYIRLWQGIDANFALTDIKSKGFKFATAETLKEISMGSYYRLPVVLLEGEQYKGLSLRAILLYMIILDRLVLSKRYGRADKDGRLWTTIDFDQTSQDLGCSFRSISRAYKELEEIGLIERHFVKYAEKWRIYARNFLQPTAAASAVPVSAPSYTPEDICHNDGSTLPTCQNCTPVLPELHPCVAKSAATCCQNCTPVLPNLHPNQISNNQTNLNYISEETNLKDLNQLPQIPENFPPPPLAAPEIRRSADDEIIDIVLNCYSMVHYDDVTYILHKKLDDSTLDTGLKLLDQCYVLVRSDMFSSRANIFFGNRPVPKAKVMQEYSRLSPYTIFLIIEKVIPRLNEIKNLDAYLHWCLLTAADHHASEAYILKKDLGA